MSCENEMKFTKGIIVKMYTFSQPLTRGGKEITNCNDFAVFEDAEYLAYFVVFLPTTEQ